MYLVKSLEEVRNLEGKFKLSYIERIPETYNDWTPETKEYMETEEYRKDHEVYGWNNPKCVMKEYPNPDYIVGKQEYYAYFCEVDEMGDVWADDADDTPYEHNCSAPYDWIGEEEIVIIKVPFSYPDGSFRGTDLTIKQPRDWVCDNSHWCMEDINLGAIPWLFARTSKKRGRNKGVSLMAGITPKEFVKGVNRIWDLADESDKDNYKFLGLYRLREVEFLVVLNEKSWYYKFYDPTTLGPISVCETIGYWGEVFDTYHMDYEDWDKAGVELINDNSKPEYENLWRISR